MMRYRGSDDDVIGFGHFSEARKLKTGPEDVLAAAACKSSLSYLGSKAIYVA